MCLERQTGFSIVAAIFLLVVLALLGVRAYQAARAGAEWGAYQVLDPNNALNPATCSPIVMPDCPVVNPTDLTGLAQSLSPFTVTVQCTRLPAWDTTEGNRNVRVFEIVATACNQPPCPQGAPTSGYVERRITATLSKCKDSTALQPRCACG